MDEVTIICIRIMYTSYCLGAPLVSSGAGEKSTAQGMVINCIKINKDH